MRIVVSASRRTPVRRPPRSAPAGQSLRAGTCAQAFGLVGAAAGALLGRVTLLPAAGALALGTAGAALAGPAGAALGGLAGAFLGWRLEMGQKFLGTFPAGRVLGGALGGVVGYGLGCLVGALDPALELPEALVRESGSFSLGRLPGLLADPSHTRHEKLSARTFQEIMERIRPGDLVITTQDATLDTEIPQRLLEGRGAGGWVHGAVYCAEGQLVESNGYFGAVVMRPLRQSLAVSEHVRVVRPRYRDERQAREVVEEARRRVGRPFGFDLRLDPATTYCTEFVYHLLKDRAPQIRIQPGRLLGLQAVTGDAIARSPDMEPVYDTGSSLLLNYLSKFG